MYSVSQIRRGLSYASDNPAVLGREANRLYYRRLYSRPYNSAGTAVVEEDWDTLIILDACRYDLFEQHNTLPGRLERRQSRGSHTREFLRGNFDGRRLTDTVYVTATPQLARWRSEIDTTFRDVVNVWQDAGWDEEHGTVLPETMTDHALTAASEYPDKRLIIHYLQPHYPFIDRPLVSDGNRFDADGEDIWRQMMFGDQRVDSSEIWDAYRENLERVLPSVEVLLDELDGKTVVTSDHGNMIGERAAPVPIREWGHPPGIYTPKLVTVPWLVYKSGPRRDVTAGETTSTSDQSTDKQTVNDRLKSLGYVE